VPQNLRSEAFDEFIYLDVVPLETHPHQKLVRRELTLNLDLFLGNCIEAWLESSREQEHWKNESRHAFVGGEFASPPTLNDWSR
jgi:hypothetical protein